MSDYQSYDRQHEKNTRDSAEQTKLMPIFNESEDIFADVLDDADLLKEYYVERGFSKSKLAELTGEQESMVRSRLRKFGVMREEEITISESELRKKYIENGHSQKELVQIFDASYENTLRHLNYYGINKTFSEAKKDQWDSASRPAPFGTYQGYERWSVKNPNTTVLVHRLVAVAEYGFEKVADNDVHHRNGISWDNRPSNLKVKSKKDHIRDHWNDETLYSKIKNASDDELRTVLNKLSYDGDEIV